MRTFIYDGKKLDDPDPKLTVEEVRHSLVQFFPELSNSEFKETKSGEDTVITFTRRVGTKGAVAFKNAQKACDDWDTQNPTGSKVVVTKDMGEAFHTHTRSAAFVALSGQAVIWVEGISGYYLLSRVKADA